MPVDVKVDFEFECIGAKTPGWSEGFYLKQAATIENALEGARQIAVKRVNLLPRPNGVDFAAAGTCRINTIRVSDVTVTGDSLEFIPGAGNLNPLTGLYPDDSLPPNTTFVARCESTSLYRRTWEFSGIPLSFVVKGGQFKVPLSPVWLADFAVFQDIMTHTLPSNTGNPPGSTGSGTGGTPAFRVRTKNPPIPIAFITLSPALGGTASVSTAPTAHGLAVGDPVKLSKVVWNPGDPALPNYQNSAPRGAYFVAAIPSPTATSFTLLAKAPKKSLFTGAYVSGGLLFRQPIILVPFTSIILESVGSRRRGRLFGQPAGRRKALKLA